MDFPWYARQYAKISIFYTKATGRSTRLLPVSPYVKPYHIPIKSYIKQTIALRNFFVVHGQYFSPPTEAAMQEDCIKFMARLNWNLVAQEWTVIEDRSETGKGDLVFSNGNSYCIFECKRRTNEKVYKQSRYYASAWKLYYAPSAQQPVLYGVWTPRVQAVIGILYSETDANKLCNRRMRYYGKQNHYLE
jgi:hypothetical protein